MSADVESPTVTVEEHPSSILMPSNLASPEPESRGRKRRRSPLRLTLVSGQTPSGESATLRGRQRHRSTSLLNISSRATSMSLRDASHSPSRRRLLCVMHLERKRSQSPSRSCSPNGKDVPKRRSQRTRSRSRSHHDVHFASVDLKSPLQFEFVARGKEAPGQEEED